MDSERADPGADYHGGEGLRKVETTPCPFLKSTLLLVDDALCGESRGPSDDQQDADKQSKMELNETLKFLRNLFVRDCHHEQVSVNINDTIKLDSQPLFRFAVASL